jgi:hypothetical protein
MSHLVDKPMKDVSPHYVGKETGNISELINRLEEVDFQTHTDKYRAEVDLLAEDLASQLRHRADMMRRRAHEFDELAGSLESLSKRVVDNSLTFYSSTEDVRTLLAEHAHINPTKVGG